jgi:hypothetical protein
VISAPSVSGNNFLHVITFCAYEANAAAFKVTRLVGSKLLQATKQDAPALACDLCLVEGFGGRPQSSGARLVEGNRRAG